MSIGGIAYMLVSATIMLGIFFMFHFNPVLREIRREEKKEKNARKVKTK